MHFKLLPRYFSSRNRFIWGQQRIEIQGLQPWCEPNAHPAGEGELLYRGKGNLQTAGNRILASHWLRPCREEDASFSSCWALPSAQGSLFWPPSSNWGFSSFICRLWSKISDPFPRPICRQICYHHSHSKVSVCFSLSTYTGLKESENVYLL